MEGWTSPTDHIWATSGSCYLVEGMGGGGCWGWRQMCPGEGTGVMGARAHPEWGDSGDKGPSLSSVFDDLHDPPEGSHISPAAPSQPQGSWGFVPAPEVAHPSCHGAPGCHTGSCSFGTLFPCHPLGVYWPPPERVPAQRRSPHHKIGGDTEEPRVLGAAPGAKIPHSGKGHVPEGSPQWPRQVPKNTPGSLPSPRGLIHTGGMAQNLAQADTAPHAPYMMLTGVGEKK